MFQKLYCQSLTSQVLRLQTTAPVSEHVLPHEKRAKKLPQPGNPVLLLDQTRREKSFTKQLEKQSCTALH